MSEGKCAIIGRVCPKTNKETDKLYCPDWVENVPEVEKDGSGNITANVFYTGCQRRRAVLYQLSVVASAGQAAASADKAASESRKAATAAKRIETGEAFIGLLSRDFVSIGRLQGADDTITISDHSLED